MRVPSKKSVESDAGGKQFMQRPVEPKGTAGGETGSGSGQCVVVSGIKINPLHWQLPNTLLTFHFVRMRYLLGERPKNADKLNWSRNVVSFGPHVFSSSFTVVMVLLWVLVVTSSPEV